MRIHHTKNKGDLGLFHAQLDLVSKGYGILLPVTEHEAFDLVAYQGTTFVRVQVKYRRAVNGVIYVPFKSSWADRNGIHTIPMDKDAVDVVCVYCPDTTRCYYIDPRQHRVGVHLRLTPPRNNQSRGVWLASDFTNLPGPLAQLERASPF